MAVPLVTRHIPELQSKTALKTTVERNLPIIYTAASENVTCHLSKIVGIQGLYGAIAVCGVPVPTAGFVCSVLQLSIAGRNRPTWSDFPREGRLFGKKLALTFFSVTSIVFTGYVLRYPAEGPCNCSARRSGRHN